MVCVNTLSAFAHVEPARVLPLIIARFRAAVEAETATHQLVSVNFTCVYIRVPCAYVCVCVRMCEVQASTQCTQVWCWQA